MSIIWNVLYIWNFNQNLFLIFSYISRYKLGGHCHPGENQENPTTISAIPKGNWYFAFLILYLKRYIQAASDLKSFVVYLRCSSFSFRARSFWFRKSVDICNSFVPFVCFVRCSLFSFRATSFWFLKSVDIWYFHLVPFVLSGV